MIDTELFNAVVSNDIETCKQLLRSKASPDAQVETSMGYRTPLIQACISENYEIAHLLLKNGANPNFNPNSDKLSGDYPLNIAIIKNNIKMVALLLNHGAQTEVYDAKGKSPLMLAIEQDNGDIISLLINNGADFDKKKLLIQSATTNNLKLLLYILQFHTDINTNLNEEEETALFLAVRHRATEVCRTLLETGALTNIIRKNTTPLTIACNNNDAPIVKLLLEHGANPNLDGLDGELNNRIRPNAVELAITNNSKEVLQLLIEHGAKLELTSGLLPLDKAIEDLSIDVCELLLQTDASCYEIPGLCVALNDDSGYGYPPEKISLLSDYASTLPDKFYHNYNDYIEDGISPFVWLAMSSESPTVIRNISQYYDLNIVNDDARTSINLPLDIEFSGEEIIRYILKSQLDINTDIEIGELLKIIRNFVYESRITKECYEFILQNMHDINATDSSGQTLLFKICDVPYKYFRIWEMEFISFFRLLLKNGADINHLDHNGHSVLSSLLLLETTLTQIQSSTAENENPIFNLRFDKREVLRFSMYLSALLILNGANYHHLQHNPDPIMQKNLKNALQYGQQILLYKFLKKMGRDDLDNIIWQTYSMAYFYQREHCSNIIQQIGTVINFLAKHSIAAHLTEQWPYMHKPEKIEEADALLSGYWGYAWATAFKESSVKLSLKALEYAALIQKALSLTQEHSVPTNLQSRVALGLINHVKQNDDSLSQWPIIPASMGDADKIEPLVQSLVALFCQQQHSGLDYLKKQPKEVILSWLRTFHQNFSHQLLSLYIKELQKKHSLKKASQEKETNDPLLYSKINETLDNIEKNINQLELALYEHFQSCESENFMGLLSNVQPSPVSFKRPCSSSQTEATKSSKYMKR